ncbi:hypothetical protein [uncultured Algibacter sp.]|uniref:hypothetical protein n=1 Tax=uncultured Algibacter sp. TaxID=298659 RepID=UPI0026093A99|nr:hypothetical protein [uncultured Algibacter sp.]
MKKLIYTMVALLIFSTAMAQEKPTEVKEEVKVKTIKQKNGENVTEKRIKMVTRETSNVELEESDIDKINQKRVDATTKVEKKIMVAKNSNNFKTLSKATYYTIGDENYMFTPQPYGFDLENKNANDEFVIIAKAWVTEANGSYIIKGKTQNGVGYFDKEGNFVIDYYDEQSDSIKSTIYNNYDRDIK